MTFSISEVAMSISAAICATWAVAITISRQPPVNLDPLYSKLDAIFNLLHTTREEFMPKAECDKKCSKIEGNIKELSGKIEENSHRRKS